MAYPQYFYPQQQMYPQQMNQNMQIQNSGFVSVRSEAEARSYPVAYGNSVTFKDETAPYVYTKTMGFSQLETPRFEKYKLVKEEPNHMQEAPNTIPAYAEKSEIEAIWNEIEEIKKAFIKENEHAESKQHDKSV